jgi:hypothetical protein
MSYGIECELQELVVADLLVAVWDTDLNSATFG